MKNDSKIEKELVLRKNSAGGKLSELLLKAGKILGKKYQYGWSEHWPNSYTYQTFKSEPLTLLDNPVRNKRKTMRHLELFGTDNEQL